MITSEHVSKRFGDVVAVKDVTVDIKKGEVFGLIGTNGAGKSTFLRMVSGVLKPDNGSVIVDDKRVYENPGIKSEIFYISDDQYYLDNANPIDMMNFYKDYYPQFDTMRFISLLDKFSLDKKRKINTYSKGNAKIVHYVLNMLQETFFSSLELFFFKDEPT